MASGGVDLMNGTSDLLDLLCKGVIGPVFAILCNQGPGDALASLGTADTVGGASHANRKSCDLFLMFHMSLLIESVLISVWLICLLIMLLLILWFLSSYRSTRSPVSGRLSCASFPRSGRLLVES